MKQFELKHINDKEWLKNRELQWEQCQRYSIIRETYNKREFDAYREFFFTGDYYAYLKKYKPEYPPMFINMLEFFPAETVENILLFSKQFWQWSIEENNRNMVEPSEKIVSAFAHVAEVGQYYPVQLKAEFFVWFYGVEFTPTRKIDIGIDSLEFEMKLKPLDIYERFLYVFRFVLYSDDKTINYSHFVQFTDYFLQLIHKHIPNEYYAIELANMEKTYRDSSDNEYNLVFGQHTTRVFLLNLMGIYDDEEGEQLHNCPDVEQKLRKALFEELKMPEEFYELVEYLKVEGLSAAEWPDDPDE